MPSAYVSRGQALTARLGPLGCGMSDSDRPMSDSAQCLEARLGKARGLAPGAVWRA